MLIKDLEISKELSRKELSAVRGGVAVAAAGGQAILGGGFFSGINAVNAPNATANDNDTTTLVSIKSALVQQSLGTLLFQ